MLDGSLSRLHLGRISGALYGLMSIWDLSLMDLAHWMVVTLREKKVDYVTTTQLVYKTSHGEEPRSSQGIPSEIDNSS